MTIKEFIKELEKYPSDMKIMIIESNTSPLLDLKERYMHYVEDDDYYYECEKADYGAEEFLTIC
jgi:hypothetical protein